MCYYFILFCKNLECILLFAYSPHFKLLLTGMTRMNLVALLLLVVLCLDFYFLTLG